MLSIKEKATRSPALWENSPQAGLTVVSALLAVGLLVSLGGIMVRYYGEFSLRVSALVSSSERDRIYFRVTSAAMNAEILRASRARLPVSHPFRLCLDDTSGTTDCEQTVAERTQSRDGDFLDVPLFDSRGNALTGTRTQPRRYTLDGAPCDPATVRGARCPLKVSTRFAAVCPSGRRGDRCAQAQYVKLLVMVEEEGMASGSGSRRVTLATRSTPLANPIHMNVSDIVPLTIVMCPPGQTRMGTDPATGRPICQMSSSTTVCANGQLLTGLNSDGTVRCQSTWNCRIASATGGVTGPTTASCAGDEVVMSGGGRCLDPQGFIYHTEPVANGWRVNCADNRNISQGVAHEAHAVCCKKVGS